MTATTAPTLEELRAVTTVTITRAGAFIGLSPATSYRAANDGSLPTIQVGKHRRVPTPLLLQLLGLDWEPRDAARDQGVAKGVA